MPKKLGVVMIFWPYSEGYFLIAVTLIQVQTESFIEIWWIICKIFHFRFNHPVIHPQLYCNVHPLRSLWLEPLQKPRERDSIPWRSLGSRWHDNINNSTCFCFQKDNPLKTVFWWSFLSIFFWTPFMNGTCSKVSKANTTHSTKMKVNESHMIVVV